MSPWNRLVVQETIVRLRPLLLAIAIGSGVAATPLPAEPLDRQVAEWALLMGGSVNLTGQRERIRDISALPAADFRLVLLDLTSEEDGTAEILRSPKRDPEDQASERELSSVLSGVIEGLPDLYRVVFVLRELENLSTAEVADSLAISEENVKVRLHRARALLRRDIDKRIGTEARSLYAFHLKRCDRIVTAVRQRMRRSSHRENSSI